MFILQSQSPNPPPPPPIQPTYRFGCGRVYLNAGGVEQQPDDILIAAVRGEMQRRHAGLVAQHAQHAHAGRRIGLDRRRDVRQ